MKAKLLAVLLLMILLLSGCVSTKPAYYKIVLNNTNTNSKLTVHSRYTLDDKLILEKNNYSSKELTSLVSIHESLFAVLDHSTYNECNLDFKDGIFFIKKDGSIVGIDRTYMSQNEGKRFYFGKAFEDNTVSDAVILNKITDPNDLQGAVYLIKGKVLKTSGSTLFNTLGPDHYYKAAYVPISEVIKEKNNQWVIKLDTQNIIKKDFEDGLRFLFINSNSKKTKKDIYEGLIAGNN